MNLVFFGSSDFSLSALKACVDSGVKIVKVITTPDRKKGRGLKELPTPVRVFAEERGLPVTAPESLKTGDLIREIEALKPDIYVVSSYGKMIPEAWLKIPEKYRLNVHPSLLPKHRGAAPVNWPILNGEAETGLSIAEVTDKLDAGDIFYQTRIPIGPDDDSSSLTRKLADLSYEVMLLLLKKIQAGETLPRTPQMESDNTYARKLTKEDGLISWNLPAWMISNKVRGLLPWPAAYFSFKGDAVQVLKAHEEGGQAQAGLPGKITQIRKTGEVLLQTAEGILVLEAVKPAGKKEMAAAEFIRGRRLGENDILQLDPAQ